jgi:putative methionine-R-sulfoxide reductase with GAF domain
MVGTSVSGVNFVQLRTAVMCVQCELISENHTPYCLACGSKALLSLPRVFGGSLRHQPTARLIRDAELNQLVRQLLGSVPPFHDTEPELIPAGPFHLSEEMTDQSSISSMTVSADMHEQPALVTEPELEPVMNIITEKAQSMTGATGAAIALRRGDEIVCRARAGRTAPDLGVRLHNHSGFSAECVRRGEIMLCEDAEKNSRVDLVTCRQLGVRSILVAPLRHLYNSFGIFEVLSSRPHAFDDRDVASLQLLSGLMTAAITRFGGQAATRS